MTEFETAIKAAAEKAVLKIISEGSWVMPDYANRFKIPPEMLAGIWGMVDTAGVQKKLAARLEQELADRIVNHMAAEIATDIKQILSVNERREAIRSIVRAHFDQIMQAGK
jgi:hypothetical protein